MIQRFDEQGDFITIDEAEDRQAGVWARLKARLAVIKAARNYAHACWLHAPEAEIVARGPLLDAVKELEELD